MKRQIKFEWIFGLFAVLLLAACSGFFELGNEEITSLEDPNKPSTTFITIDNTANKYPVDIYYDSSRTDKIGSVGGNQTSAKIEQKPTINNPRSFYITYNLPVVAGVQIPYIPKGVNGVIDLHIFKNETTPVKINPLSTSIDPNDALFDNAWLAIKNTGGSACRLSYYTSIYSPVNTSSSIFDFNPGFTALYKFESLSDIDLSKILINSSSLPDEITSFEKGWLYEVEFNGTTATLKSSKLLTLSSLP